MASVIRPLGEVASIRDAVEEMLAVAIISGELEQSSLVTAPNLAKRLGVSATPVREAMIDLEKRGFVESVRYKGFRIRGMSGRELHELVEVRQWLEGPAMAAIARTAQPAQIEAFRARAGEVDIVASEPDVAAFIDADNQFHIDLLDLTGNANLKSVVAELRGKTRLVGLAGMAGTDELRSTANEHHTLLDLLANGDADGADLFMRRHVGHVVGWWAGRL